LLNATLAIEPTHAQLGPLVETLVQQGRAGARQYWNTQDYASVVLALLPYERMRRQAPATTTVRLRSSSGAMLEHTVRAGELSDTSVALTGWLRGESVQLDLSAANPAAPVYYFVTLRQVPRNRPVTPLDNGIQVERWYERVDTRRPVTTVTAGELVRVRLRITVPDERHFVVVDDPLPAGIEAVDPSLRTEGSLGAYQPIPGAYDADPEPSSVDGAYGRWYLGSWSAFDHRELRDDRVILSATTLWKGSWTASYLARATTAGTFVVAPAHAEEMYNPAINGRTAGGLFGVKSKE
jgi:uncharacterized protein YfaS (alpha-2-macroglobulin family)